MNFEGRKQKEIGDFKRDTMHITDFCKLVRQREGQTDLLQVFKM